MQWKRPRNERELLSLPGFAKYNRELIRGHGELVEPMNSLVKKNQEFQWNPQAEEAFELTNKKLCSAPVLALPGEEALHFGHRCLGCGHFRQEQEVDGKLKVRPIAYGSKMLNSNERN